MFRDFGSFIAALWREWVVLVTGGIIGGGLVLLGFLVGKPLPQRFGWLFLGLTLILAAFLAWRRQWIGADQNFLAVAPEDLVQLTHNRTKVHANTHIKPYLGKKVRWTGTIDNVFPSRHLAFVTMECGTLHITLRLPRWGMRPFVPLPKGTTITIEGRIYAISHSDITLTNCDIVPAPPERKAYRNSES